MCDALGHSPWLAVTKIILFCLLSHSGIGSHHFVHAVSQIEREPRSTLKDPGASFHDSFQSFRSSYVAGQYSLQAPPSSAAATEAHPPPPLERRGPWASRASLPVAGSAKTALAFDGKDDFVLVRSFRSLPTSNMTVAAWVRVSEMKSFNRIVSHKWVTSGWNLYVDQSGVLRFGIGQNNLDFSASKVIFRDRWHYVCGTYDGHHLRVFVDGVEGARTQLKGAELDASGYLSIAGAEWDPFHGTIDEVRLWNAWRSKEQIYRDMVDPPAGNEEAMVGYWKFDEGGGHTAYDTTRFRNHATLGMEHRAPAWVASSAPVRVSCTVRGMPLQVHLEGMAEMAMEPQAIITKLPAMGELFQLHGNGGGGTCDDCDDNENGDDDGAGAPTISGAIVMRDDGHKKKKKRVVTHVPVKVEDVRARMLFFVNKSSGASPFSSSSMRGRRGGGQHDLVGTSCVTIEYIVDDGVSTSESTGLVLIDVVDDEGGCRKWSSPHYSPCWSQRTQLEYAVPSTRPPRVSVIIPVFNAAKHLPETVASVVAQTFQDWEIVMVDDGSTDDGGASWHTMESLVLRYAQHRLRVLKKPNGGLADARNAGIAAAHAEWVLPLDADDLITPEFLERAFTVLDDSSGTHDDDDNDDDDDDDDEVNLVIADLKGFGAWEYSWAIPDFDPVDLRYANTFHCSAVFKKDLWKAAGGYPTTTLFGYEDWAFWIRVTEEASIRPHRIREDLFLYRISPHSMHRSLMGHQDYAVASLRILFPSLYPVELLLSAHRTFMKPDSPPAPDRVVMAVEEKVLKFPREAAPRLMRGLIHEGIAYGEDSGLHNNGSSHLQAAVDDYQVAVDLAPHNDWQPLWRLGLLQQKMGLCTKAKLTLGKLFHKFSYMSRVHQSPDVHNSKSTCTFSFLV